MMKHCFTVLFILWGNGGVVERNHKGYAILGICAIIVLGI